MSAQEEPPVLSDIINNTGILTFNRPKSLNAFNLPMVNILLQKLKDWENKVQCVILRGGGDRAFCAGGDVVAITNFDPTASKFSKDIIRQEYTLAYAIGRFNAPVVALIDGITMGGGAGLAANAKYRVATERTIFAMPETAIGIFPDVSGSYFLPRLEGKLGLYLALTCERLKGKDVAKVGFATHFIESKDMPKLYDALIKENDLEKVLKRHTLDVSKYTFSLAPQMSIINEAFSAPTVEGIVRRLEREGSEFSLKTVQTMKRMSPFAMKVCKVQLEKGARMSLKECLQMEYRIAHAVLEATSSRDFYEGVRALLKDKDRKPKWRPATLQEVTDEMVERAFWPLPPEEELTCKL